MSWKEKLVAGMTDAKFAICGIVAIVISGHLQGMNGELTIAALAILGTYAAIKKN